MTIIQRQKEIEGALAALFASSSRLALLRVLLTDPRRAYYQRQLEKATGVQVRGVQRELDRLAACHFLYRHTEGRRAYYQVDVEHPIFRDLQRLVLRGTDEQTQLRAELASRPDVRLIFGRSQDRRVLVVGDFAKEPTLEETYGYAPLRLTTTAFTRRLQDDPESLAEFLREGEDWLGRRDDVIWRRIEAAGFDVVKGKGVL